METLTGILLNVSGCRKENAFEEIEKDNFEWARACFSVIENLVKYEVSRNNHVFALGNGSKYGNGIFDVLKTIELSNQENTENEERWSIDYGNCSNVNNRHILNQCKPKTQSTVIPLHDKPILPGDEHWTVEKERYDRIVEMFFRLVERNGAPLTREVTLKETIQSVLHYDIANLLFNALKSSKGFLKEFVSECLPSECKPLLQKPYVFDTDTKASEKTITFILENAMGRLQKDAGSVFSVQRALEVLHGMIDGNRLDRIKQLVTTIMPFCLGRKPLNEALNKTTDIFKNEEYSKHKKLLFVLSDGEPTDTYFTSVFERLKALKVTVACILIDRDSKIQPRRLYSVENLYWGNEAKYLFKLSSTISSQFLPRSIFFKKGWNIDIENSQTKLFLKVNRNENIHDACNLVRHVVRCEDSLSDHCLSVLNDVYINQNIHGFTAQQQSDGTCYANASAAIMFMSMKRIIGRKGGYPDFKDLREKIIKLHGKNGAITLNVLKEICPQYRLRCEVVDIHEAESAITAKRQVVATFSLSDLKWAKFSKYFKQNPTGIISKADIDIPDQGPGGEISGHAVLLTSFNFRSLRLLNSWGHKWADQGFFKVQNSEVLDFKFIDVYWTLKDLLPTEIDYFKEHGDENKDVNDNSELCRIYNS